MDQATTWEEFREACTYNRMPAENMVWADRRGTSAGRRLAFSRCGANWSGLLPVPGDGRYEWDGYLPITALPHEANPARGFIAHREQLPVPERLPVQGGAALHLGRSVPRLAHHRGARLGTAVQHRRDDAPAERRPVAARPAPGAAAADVAVAEPARGARRASCCTAGTSCSTRTRSRPASTRCGSAGCWPTPAQRLIPAALRGQLGELALDVKRVIDWLHAPDGRFGAEPDARHATRCSRRSLDEAVAELTKRFGPDMRQVAVRARRRYHHALIRHPLTAAVNEATRAKLNVGPLPRGGDGRHHQRHRRRRQPDVRRLVQDRSPTPRTGTTRSALNNPGQSGNPDEPALPRSVRDLGEGPLLPRRLLTREGGVGHRERDAARHRANDAVREQ